AAVALGWRRSLTLLGLMLAIVAMPTRIVRAEGNVKDLSAIAKTIAEALKKASLNEIALDQIDPPPNTRANNNPGIAKFLEDDLRKEGIKVVRRGDLGVKASFHIQDVGSKQDNPGKKDFAIVFEGVVEQKDGTTLPNSEFRTEITDPRLVALF